MSFGATFSHQTTNSNQFPPSGGFSQSVAALLERIDYRLACSGEEREAIFRLRYQAYMREAAILPTPTRKFSDRYDEMANVCLFGLYIDDELASSVRLHVVCKQHRECPSVEAFPDFLQPELDAGKIIVDSTRFVADERLSRLYRGLPYATVRLSWLAAAHFEAGHLLAAVRVEHQAFYRRVFRHQLVCEPRSYPGLTKPLSLMTAHYPTAVEYVHRRYPFFRSTYFERRMLFESHQLMPEASHAAVRARSNHFSFAELSATNVAG
jgi:hypothetical protein